MSDRETISCVECGVRNRARALFCSSCGARIPRSRRTGALKPTDPGRAVTATRPMGSRRIRGWLASFDFDDNGESFVLRQGENVLGRDPRACSVLLAGDPGVSRQHCVITAREDGVYLSDADSQNGTTLNGEALEGKTRTVNDGDRIGVCGYTLIVKLLP
ncbi:MAG: FHA domain-containing protein [Alphaproteobacteria bacterium]|nr:FHA domain-containing protein [Alphaproteobacteria bacterium]